jgi:NIMA (never in mitosis gene a)-related kinase
MKGFEIINKLGDGAFSIVYKVRRKVDNKIYALKKVKMKTLNEKEKKNSLNEVRILASIKSPFVISYKEAFISEEDQSLCIVMEYADKGDLYQEIVAYKKKKQLFDEIDVWKIFIQMTRGLKSLHDLKILHRDFKSANIFLFSDGSAKIGDLNVSKVVYKGLGHTQTGTPYYASPEVWNNNSYDTKSDIWSLACITYEMLTLNPPFRAETFEGLYKKVIAGKYNKISNKYSYDMSELLRLLFKVNPKERPSCGEILKHPLIQKRIEFFTAQIGLDKENIDIMDDNELLKTIRLSKDLVGLQEKLPKANYNLPEIKVNTINNATSNNNNIPNKINNIKTYNNGNHFPPINRSKTNDKNYNNNTNNFKFNRNQFSQNRKTMVNNLKKIGYQITQRNTNLYTSPGKTRAGQTKYEGRKNNMYSNYYSSTKRKNNIKSNKRILETYRLYVSNDSKRYIGKSTKNNLPKIYLPKSIRISKNKK